MSSKTRRLSKKEARKWLNKLDREADDDTESYEEEDHVATRKLRRELEAIVDSKQKELPL